MVESEVSVPPEPDRAAPDPPQAEGDPPQDAADSKASKEAARYRRQLRAAEAERDGLAARLESVQRSQVDAQVVAAGIKPAALWASGVELAALLGEDGTVDPKLVAEKVAGVREQFGIEPPKPPKPVKGLQSGAASGSIPTPPSWEKAFAPGMGVFG